MTRASKRSQNDDACTGQEGSPEESAVHTNTLLRNNLLKLKQKVIDTNKLLDLYSAVKSELDASHKKIRAQALDAKNLQFQIDRLIQERDPLLKAIQDKTEEISRLRKEAEQSQIACQSQNSLCVQLKAELEDTRKDRVRWLQQSEKDSQELERAKRNAREMEMKLNKANVFDSQLHTELTREKAQVQLLTSTLSNLLPVLLPLSGTHLQHSHITKIENALGRQPSKPPTVSKQRNTITPPQPIQDLSLEDEEDSDSDSMEDFEAELDTLMANDHTNYEEEPPQECIPPTTSIRSPEAEKECFKPPRPRAKKRTKTKPKEDIPTPVCSSSRISARKKDNSNATQEILEIQESSDVPEEIFPVPDVPEQVYTKPTETTPPKPRKRKRTETTKQSPETPPRKIHKSHHEQPVEHIDTLNEIPEAMESYMEQEPEIEISLPILPLKSPEPVEFRSYSIKELMESVETYSKHLDIIARWPMEEEEKFMQRRLDMLLSDLSAFPLDQIQYQKLLLTATYDLSHESNRVSLENFVPLLLRSYSKLHQLIIRKSPSKSFKQYIEQIIKGSETSSSAIENKLKMLNDLAWNLHLTLNPKRESLPHNRTVSFLDTLIAQMTANICKNALDTTETTNSLSFKQRVLLCKRATEFAKASGDIYFVRNLVYHILSLFPAKLSLFMISSIVFVWPQPLEKPQEGSELLYLLVRCILQDAAGDNDNMNVLYDDISAICKWEEPAGCVEDFIVQCSKQLATCSDQDENTIHDIKTAFLLLCRKKGWPWTYNYLICKNLARLMLPTSSEATLSSVILLLGSLCKTGMIISGDSKLMGTNQLRARILSLLQPSSPVSIRVQETAAQALCDASGGLKSNLQGILLWFHSLDSSVQASLSPSLQENIEAIKKQSK